MEKYQDGEKFRIASVTKPIVAAIARATWSNPESVTIGQYLPVTPHDSSVNSITILELISHTSGNVKNLSISI